MADIFQKNSVIRLRAEFKTPKTAVPPNSYTDPATVILSVMSPDKTVTTYTYGVSGVDKDDVGKYSALVTLDQEGTYHWRWVGSNGSVSAGVAVGQFDSRMEPNF